MVGESLPMRATPKQKMRHAGVKTSLPPLSARASRQYDKMLNGALSRLDADDYKGFWDQLEDLNDMVREARGG